MSLSVANALQEGRQPGDMQPDEAVIYDLCMELAATHELSDATFARARALFSDQQIVDLITVAGAYVMVSMQLAAGREGNPDGSTPLRPAGSNL